MTKEEELEYYKDQMVNWNTLVRQKDREIGKLKTQLEESKKMVDFLKKNLGLL